MPKQFSNVIVIDNESGEIEKGKILEYTRDRIVIKKHQTFKEYGKLAETKIITFDAKKVHFG